MVCTKYHSVETLQRQGCAASCWRGSHQTQPVPEQQNSAHEQVCIFLTDESGAKCILEKPLLAPDFKHSSPPMWLSSNPTRDTERGERTCTPLETSAYIYIHCIVAGWVLLQAFSLFISCGVKGQSTRQVLWLLNPWSVALLLYSQF